MQELIDENEYKEENVKTRKLESFLQGLSSISTKQNLETKMMRLLKKYRERKDNEEKKRIEWEYINSIKPDTTVNHPDDVKAIQDAEKTIGDYKLKIDPSYVVNEGNFDTVLTKYKELLTVREEVNLYIFIQIKCIFGPESKNAHYYGKKPKKLLIL